MIEPTSDQERAFEAICLRAGGWAKVDPPAQDRTCVVTIAGGDHFIVNEDGSALNAQTNEIEEVVEHG